MVTKGGINASTTGGGIDVEAQVVISEPSLPAAFFFLLPVIE